MASTTASAINPKDLESFSEHVKASKRIVALLGAGISASSGLPTFRGAGGLWRTHDATQLATPHAFRQDPGMVWQFYSYRRHMALNAKPNRAHMALAELARRKPQFITMSQNVDGLSPRANHPPEQLKLMHGNLFDVKCIDERRCGYVEINNFTDPIVPALALPENTAPTATSGAHSLLRGADISQISTPLAPIPTADLPHCPKCKTNLLRPGVVWFGETRPFQVMQDIDAFFASPEPIDLMIVIGTSGMVVAVDRYASMVRQKGGRVAVLDMKPGTAGRLSERDWFFQGDAAYILPELLKDVIGEVAEFVEGPDGRAV